MAATTQNFYELYRRSSVGAALTDTLDDLITDHQIDPQLAMKVLANFDRAITEVLQEKVKARLSFKGSLDTYRFCDEVWTFQLKNVIFKMDNNSQAVSADKVKIVSCTAKPTGNGP
ncbi:transcription initiation factor IIA gamma chain [Durotheca rogersii]|uniref:transcription initiation factor IIA gamma chain n=1 Tax=Durotheca rogersii TaxID=419775 RepID=UPI0022210A49|nr:transcription initiation factor IIA gamma chain [Durotheca rogersii]KAI5861932.1 transcription initiation factor IIA gamma chain [Durotheca rogersii]